MTTCDVGKKYGEGTVSFEGLIKELLEIFESDHVNVDQVIDLLGAYRSNPLDWNKYVKFDDHRYTRNLVHEGNGKFNLMLLCWGEGMGSSIHDHSGAHCFVKMLDGQLQETLYEWPTEEDAAMGAPLVQRSVNQCQTNQVAYINDSIGLHRMENPSHTDKAISLHLYSPPFSKCMMFDERTGHQTQCKVTFWSKFGERTPLKVPESAC